MVSPHESHQSMFARTHDTPMAWLDALPRSRRATTQPCKCFKQQIHCAGPEKLYLEEERSQNEWKVEIPKGQVFVPIFERTKTILLTGKNHA